MQVIFMLLTGGKNHCLVQIKYKTLSFAFKSLSLNDFVHIVSDKISQDIFPILFLIRVKSRQELAHNAN